MIWSSYGWFENEFRGHLDGRLQASVYRTLVREEAMYPSGSIPVRRIRFEVQFHVQASNDQNAVLSLDFPHRF